MFSILAFFIAAPTARFALEHLKALLPVAPLSLCCILHRSLYIRIRAGSGRMAAQRAESRCEARHLTGVSLAIMTSLRIIFGIERSYLQETMIQVVNIDRRIIFVFVFLGWAALLANVILPIKPTRDVIAVYDQFEKVAEDEGIYSAFLTEQALAQCSLWRAILRHCFAGILKWGCLPLARGPRPSSEGVGRNWR